MRTHSLDSHGEKHHAGTLLRIKAPYLYKPALGDNAALCTGGLPAGDQEAGLTQLEGGCCQSMHKAFPGLCYMYVLQPGLCSCSDGLRFEQATTPLTCSIYPQQEG
jgi:hypothetical protein